MFLVTSFASWRPFQESGQNAWQWFPRTRFTAFRVYTSILMYSMVLLRVWSTILWFQPCCVFISLLAVECDISQLARWTIQILETGIQLCLLKVINQNSHPCPSCKHQRLGDAAVPLNTLTLVGRNRSSEFAGILSPDPSRHYGRSDLEASGYLWLSITFCSQLPVRMLGSSLAGRFDLDILPLRVAWHWMRIRCFAHLTFDAIWKGVWMLMKSSIFVICIQMRLRVGGVVVHIKLWLFWHQTIPISLLGMGIHDHHTSSMLGAKEQS